MSRKSYLKPLNKRISEGRRMQRAEYHFNRNRHMQVSQDKDIHGVRITLKDFLLMY
jgi:hypothetical protein